MSPKLLGFILVDRTGTYYWAGPGMCPLAALSLYRLPVWPTAKAASTAAQALSRAIGLKVSPSPLKLP